MATVADSQATVWTASEVLARFGDIPIARILTSPRPGSATEEDVVELLDHHDRLCELIDGVLVEKTMGWKESYYAMLIARLLGNYVDANQLGIVLGPDGLFRLTPGQIRLPDVAFISKVRYKGGDFPEGAFWDQGFDLAIEIISKGNTRREMERKLADYFNAGVQAVWFVNPKAREVIVYSSPTSSTTFKESETLDASPVLAGFSLSIADVFSRGPTTN